ncbi:uncharacterized protein LOC132703092 [Cylas formicarius]|uniref:uncharacterized protein LOC132703092 n=1 Tax=Cylas formicarius TaxID=197179 RepID=UPI002958902A|nr:uncharacterized protein LOC132703092 [Cylas formicarius]
MNSLHILLIIFAFFCHCYAEDDPKCQYGTFSCPARPVSCPVNQTFVPTGPCSCGCPLCKPIPPLNSIGSPCVTYIIRDVPYSNCEKGLRCCDKVCVKPEYCCKEQASSVQNTTEDV